MFKASKIFVFSVLSLLSLNSCSNELLTLPSRVAQFQQNLERDLKLSSVKVMSEYEKKAKENYMTKLESSLADKSRIAQENVAKSYYNPETKNYADPIQNKQNVSKITPAEVKNLVGKWNYNLLGQNIDVNVIEKDQNFITTGWFNGYKYEASAKTPEVTGDGIKVNGTYYGEPVVINLKPIDGDKMNFTFIDGGKNIPAFIKGMPLVFSKMNQ